MSGLVDMEVDTRVNILDEKGNLRRLPDIEADVIRMALAHRSWRITKVAIELGIGRSTLYRMIEKYRIPAK